MTATPEDQDDHAVLAALVELEHQLLDPAVRADGSSVRALLHEDFEEIGQSGMHWHRDAIVDALVGDPGVGSTTTQVNARFLAPDAVLITYAARTTEGTPVVSRRSSIWVREGARWQMIYHQGTRAI